MIATGISNQQMRISAALLFATCFFLSGAHAGEHDSAALSRDEQRVLASDAFLNAHPDLKYRLEGWTSYDEGRFEEAVAHFKKAARYADKLSQAMLAEMYWNGHGLPGDRPLAYGWADLAAERGYLQFVAVRESYWLALDADERTEAITRGQALLHEYGDAVAKPRMAKALRDARRYMAGGMIRRNSEIILPGPDGLPIRIQGGDFYASKFWESKRYQAWHDNLYQARYDKLWSHPEPTGTVIVRPLEKVVDSVPAKPRDDVPGQDTPDPAD